MAAAADDFSSGSGMEPPNNSTGLSFETFIVFGAAVLGIQVVVTALTVISASQGNCGCQADGICHCTVTIFTSLVAVVGLLVSASGLTVVFFAPGSSLLPGFSAIVAIMVLFWMVISCLTIARSCTADIDSDDEDSIRRYLCLGSHVVTFLGVMISIIWLVAAVHGPSKFGPAYIYGVFGVIFGTVLLACGVPAICCFCSGILQLRTRLTTALHARRVARAQAAIGARLKSSKALLEEALKHGFVTSQTAVCLLIGVAGTGKTHTKHLLFQKNPPEHRNSTPLAERPVRAVRVSATVRKLQEINNDDLDNILADAVAVGIPMEKTTIFACFGKKVEDQSKGISPPSPPNESSPLLRLSHATQSESPPSRSSSDHQRTYCCCISHEPESELKESTKSSLNATAHKISASTGQHQPLEGKWIYLIDSGGQIEFLEVLPAFLQDTSVCLFVTKLSEMLSEHPKIEYFERGKSVGEPTTCTFTNEEMLMRCVQTIQSQRTLQDGNANQTSQVVVVGTHQDLEHECPESRDEKNRKLLSLLCPAFDQSLVFNGQKMKELIFPLNAKNPGPQDLAVAGELTKVILNAASDTEPQKTPISWLKFEQYLQKLSSQGTRILCREACFQIACLFHLSEKEFDAALDHLASFCVIHYYFHLLPGVVFIDPHFLVGTISILVKYHYEIRHDPHVCEATRGELRKFRNEGCITLKLLKKIPMQYTDFFTAADLLKLMEDRLIITRHISKDEYFMPCLLRTMDPEEVDQHRLRSSSPVAPLAIHFSCRWVPHGMYCSLIAFLRSQDSSPWRLSLKNPTEPLCLTRNCIQFQLPEGAPGSLTLIDSFSHFEVHIRNAPLDTCNCLCPSIWHTLSKGLQKAKETLCYHNLGEPKRAFLCEHGNDHHTRRPHLARPADGVNYWSCDLYPDTMCGHLTDEHLVWFPGRRATHAEAPKETVIQMDECTPTEEALPHTRESIGTNHPTLIELVRFRGRERRINVPQEIGIKYIQFGTLLLDDPNGVRVRNMEHKYRGDAERINEEILREWTSQKGKQPVSWETLIEVLQDIELSVLASEIEAVKTKPAITL